MTSKPICNSFSHDLMNEVMTDLYPNLVRGTHFTIGHYVREDGSQCSDPFFMTWKANEVEAPDPAGLKEIFRRDEQKYRAAFARRYRDACLEWSDGKVHAPIDASESAKSKKDGWAAYRKALRDISNQPGFPFDIQWPDVPEA